MTDAVATDFAGQVELEIDGHCFVLSDAEARDLVADIEEVTDR